MKPNNPPAFPSATAPSMHGCWGMTLRDYFAAAAITAAAANLQKHLEAEGFSFDFIDEVNMASLAEDCYSAADAMLEHRQPSTAAPAERALEALVGIDCTVRVQKLAKTTLIGDCAKSLRDFLGYTQDEHRKRLAHGKNALQIKDFTHDVWVCQIGPRVAYGTTFMHAVDAALAMQKGIK